jgi:hypothetical protein
MSLSMDWDLSESLMSSSESLVWDDTMTLLESTTHSTSEIRRALTAPNKRFYITDTTFSSIHT